MRRATAIAAALAVVALAGCGAEDEPEPSSPATLAPAESSVYMESVLRPEGEQREALESSLSLLLDTDDPGALITAELNQSIAADDSEITYEGDIEPWLGERGALFLMELFPSKGESPDLGFGGEGVEGAVIVEATDTEAAEAFAEKSAAEDGPVEETTYEGVTYRLGDEGDAYGVVGDALIFGSEAAFKSVVDTDAGGPALADEEDFTGTLEAGGEPAASLYVDVPSIVEDADGARELSNSDRDALDTVFDGLVDEPVAASLEGETDGFALEFSYGSPELPLLAAANESALLRELPEDAWFAAGFSDLGEAVGSFLARAEDFGLAGVEIERAESQFLRNYGVRLKQFYAPLGDGALFASGRGVFGTGGGLVVETDSRDAAAEVLARLRRESLRSGEQVRPLTGGGPDVEGFSVAIADAPSTLNFIAASDRLVIAYGEGAAAAALEPDQTLASSDEFRTASSTLGEEFATGVFLDFGPVTELLDLAATTDPSIEQVLPYLGALDFVIAGSASDSGRDRQRLFLGLEENVSGPAT